MRAAALTLAAMAIPSMLFAEAGRTVNTVLSRTLGARAAGLGEAMTADAGDMDDIFFNPAGLARIDHPAASATYQNGLLDDNVGMLNYARDTNFGAWFVGASGLDAGKLDLNQSDGTTGSVHAQQDFAGTVGLAIGRTRPVSFGLAVKYLRSQLAETATADTIAGDAGLYWETPIPGIQLAAAIQNAGADLKYEEASESLPTAGRIGASYLWNLEESVKTPEFLKCRYLFLLDSVKPKNDDASVNAGIEIRKKIDYETVPGWAALRGGYISATKAVSVGVGFKIWNISMDYAINILNDLDNTHRVTLGYHFNPKRNML